MATQPEPFVNGVTPIEASTFNGMAQVVYANAVAAETAAEAAQVAAGQAAAPTDEQFVTLVGNPDSAARAALDAAYATREDVENVVRLFGDDYLYNATEGNLATWRTAMARAAGGGAPARISVSGSSTAYGHWSGGPYLTASWPGRLQRRLSRLGRQGTGMVIPWDLMGTAGPGTYQPVMTFAGSIADSATGVHSLGAKRITRSGTSSYIEFGPVDCDSFRVYCIGSGGSVGRAVVDGVDVGTFSGATNTTGTTFPRVEGYATGASGAGQAVTDIPTSGPGRHTLRILPNGSDGATLTVFAIEARVSSGGVVVSNLARSGATAAMLVQDNATDGRLGMSVAFDASRAHLHIIQMMTNDFQTHVPVATFKARIQQAVERQRSTTPVANGGTPAGGDVLLVAGQPVNLAAIPADGVQDPPYTAYVGALYEVATEYDVPLMDLDVMFENYAAGSARGWYADNLHASPIGHEAIAAAFERSLLRVAGLSA